MKTIYIYGSFDRFNFGDILFPLILKSYFKNVFANKPEYLIELVSPFKGDETKRGGVKTFSIKRALKKIKDKDTVIIAGGDVLPVTWLDLYLHRDNTYLGYRIACKLLSYFTKSPSKYIHNLIRNFYGDKSLPLPYSMVKRKNINIIYNSVGGASLNETFATENYTEIITHADIFNVRDNLTKSKLPNQHLISVIPDVAILTKDLISNVKEINKSTYFTIQIGNVYLEDKNIVLIANELNKINKQTGLTVVLLPIGTAHGHEDHIALRKLMPHLNEGSYKMIDCPTIEEIQSYISNTSFFIGTSLHGAITSMSYYKPHFALDFKISKLNSYIDTWQIAPFSKPVDISKLAESVFKFLESNFDRDSYKKHIDSQKKLMLNQLNIFNELIISH